MSPIPYAERRASRSEHLPVRGLNYHLRCWGDARSVSPERPPLLMMHGWMDVGASFQ
ncbi:MAG TPA: alpha/beta hydrolase, partial [Burkholderiaceae bacterium]|nr:alpha/beta hydrolase [Burkholderiaceae bacterium]